MVVCKRCGAELPDGSAFCTECGYRVTPVGQAGDRYTGFNASTGGRQAGESTGAYGSSSGSGSGYREAYSAGRPEDSLPVLAEGEMTVKTRCCRTEKAPRHRLSDGDEQEAHIPRARISEPRKQGGRVGFGFRSRVFHWHKLHNPTDHIRKPVVPRRRGGACKCRTGAAR